MADRTLRYGLVGTGYLAKAFVLGYRSAPIVFGHDIPHAEPAVVATSTAEGAAKAARELGFTRSTGDWREVVADPSIDIVVVNTPNDLHAPVALATIEAGKHVHCEKPLGLNSAEARRMTEAAEAAGVITMVGYNYRQNPATQLAGEIVRAGELGEIVSVRATHVEDFLADPSLPAGWKASRARSGYGALGDLGSHIICILESILGPMARVAGQMRTVVERRPVRCGDTETVRIETDDEARFLVEFATGVTGMVEASRIATGRKMGITYEITGTRGSLFFDQARMSEIQLYEASAPAGRQGFKTILIEATHPDYAAFGAGPGHGLGFNDQKIIECRRFLEAIAGVRKADPDFRAAWRVNAVCDAVARSAQARGWAEVVL